MKFTLYNIFLFLFLNLSMLSATAPLPGFATGIKVGEVTQNEALIWARLTSVIKGDTMVKKDSAPGSEGSIQIAYKPKEGTGRWVKIKPQNVFKDKDYIAQIKLTQLQPGTEYIFTATAFSTNRKQGQVLKGTFKTPAEANKITDVTAVVVTCQGISTTNDEVKGHWVYSQMLKYNPDLFIHTGDVVYYDRPGKQPSSKTVEACRQRWARMFSFEWNRDFNSQVSSYFMKDDHDTLKDDCYPGVTYGEMTYEKGIELFAEQTPRGKLPYRRVRWGKDVEFWFIEGRDYRSKNTDPDGPEKSILGEKQKTWLKKTLLESDATFKLAVFPGPVVGPDKGGKKDNHSNKGFKAEGDELRKFLASIPNTYVVCGDRHWQYSSKDPKTGLIEVCSGPINDASGKRGGDFRKNEKYHLYCNSAKGGFLKINVTRKKKKPQITFTWYSDEKSEKRIYHEVTYPAK